MTDFNSLLDSRVGEVEAPLPLPIGTYTLEIKSRKFDKSSQKKTDYVEFTYSIVGAEDDVDQDDLPQNWQAKSLTDTFYITADALKRLEEYLKIVGIDEGLSLREGIEQAASGGRFVKAHINHRPYQSKDGEPRIAVEIDSYAAAN